MCKLEALVDQTTSSLQGLKTHICLKCCFYLSSEIMSAFLLHYSYIIILTIELTKYCSRNILFFTTNCTIYLELIEFQRWGSLPFPFFCYLDHEHTSVVIKMFPVILVADIVIVVLRHSCLRCSKRLSIILSKHLEVNSISWHDSLKLRNSDIERLWLIPAYSQTGPVTFSSECSKHFHRLYHNTRDCSTPACKL